MSTTVSHDVLLRCVAPSGRETTLAVTLGYDAADPYAVRFDFHGPREDVAWLVARELLMTGRHTPTGEGDVLVRPDARDAVLVQFRSPAGSLETTLPRCHLDAFLDRTLALVPVGAETVDPDELLDALLQAE